MTVPPLVFSVVGTLPGIPNVFFAGVFLARVFLGLLDVFFVGAFLVFFAMRFL